jgi:hypothetical protein
MQNGALRITADQVWSMAVADQVWSMAVNLAAMKPPPQADMQPEERIDCFSTDVTRLIYLRKTFQWQTGTVASLTLQHRRGPHSIRNRFQLPCSFYHAFKGQFRSESCPRCVAREMQRSEQRSGIEFPRSKENLTASLFTSQEIASGTQGLRRR